MLQNTFTFLKHMSIKYTEVKWYQSWSLTNKLGNKWQCHTLFSAEGTNSASPHLLCASCLYRNVNFERLPASSQDCWKHRNIWCVMHGLLWAIQHACIIALQYIFEELKEQNVSSKNAACQEWKVLHSHFCGLEVKIYTV